METATAFTGAGPFPSGLGDQQNGFFPDHYDMANGIDAKSLDLGLGAGWDIPGFIDPKLNSVEANAFPTDQKTMQMSQGFPSNTIDPTSLWSDLNLSYANASSQSNSPDDADSTAVSSTPPTGSIGNRSVSTAASTDFKPSPSDSPFTAPLLEPNSSGRVDRARHAANQRHKRSKTNRKDSHQSDNEGSTKTEDSKANLKQQKLREKNKVAAAKCRSRQRKQVHNIESKCNHLSAANGELKRQIRDLSDELSGLRSLALNHQTCECSIAMYNYQQAQKVVAGLQASSLEKNSPQLQSA